MAHYSVTVCLRGDGVGDLPTAIEAAMAPFGEATSSLEREQGFLWDTWRIAENRWPWFWIAPGREEDPRLLYESPHHGEPPSLALPGHCSGGPRELLDLRPEPETGVLLIGRAWDLWQKLTAVLSSAEQGELALVIWNAQRGYQRREDAEAARRALRTHPIIEAFHAAQPLIGDSTRYVRTPPIDPYALNRHASLGYRGRETFISAHLQPLYGGSDLVTLDGWWIEMDGTAHHGTCGSDCRHRPDAFDQARHNASIPEGKTRYLEGLPGDTVLVALQGHC